MYIIITPLNLCYPAQEKEQEKTPQVHHECVLGEIAGEASSTRSVQRSCVWSAPRDSRAAQPSQR